MVEVLQGLPKRYTITNQIGCGGMGQVYEVHDNELERFVALKTLRTDCQDVPSLSYSSLSSHTYQLRQ